jgi:CubicO group peptidase (beta-lactamase class C family)
MCAVRKSPPGANPTARTRLSASRRLTSRCFAGIAHSRGLLEPPERVSDRLPGIGFDSAHNRAITWEHLLTQTSEWQGECFGMPDQVEHYRHVSHDPKPPAGKKGELRPLREPGSYWEYNDVRINQLSLALLHLFKRPLPELFLESVLRPIGGGRDFQWEGYDDAGSRSTASACSRFPVARTGAAA